MDRLEIQQHVLDTLGKILIDKSVMQGQENVLVSALGLDEEDFAEFFADLQSRFHIQLPIPIKSDLSHLPEHPDYSQLTLQGLIDLILLKMTSEESR